MRKNRKIISLILCIVLAFSVLSAASTSYAADEPVYIEYTDISQYRGTEKTHPVRTGYVFAGWYEKSGTTYLTMNETEADTAAQKQTSVYAKFVDEDVLSVKYQFQVQKTASSDTVNLRMLTSVDTLKYESVGFHITIGERTSEVMTDTVYETLIGYVDGSNKPHSPSVFSSQSAYFMTYTMSSTPNWAFEKTMKIEPQWTTLDGTTVTGIEREMAISEELANFKTGIGFEKTMDAGVFTGQGVEGQDATLEVLEYASAGVGALPGGENNVLKMSYTPSTSNPTFYYPKFRINFGTELEAGTIITFMAYGKITSGEYSYDQSAFETSTSGVAVIGGEIDQYGQFAHGGWKYITITLSEAMTQLDMFWNYDRAGITSETASGEVYIDNVRIYGSVEPDICEGINFEYKEHEEVITGQGVEGQDATIERVDYGTLGVTAPTDGGTYALKLSHESFYWPKLQMNFGKVLPIGTEITFMAYGKITSGTNKYNQSIFEFDGSGGTGEATLQFKCDAWTELTITLQEATDTLKLYWNYDRASITSSTASAEVYIDNVIAVEPLDITQGVDFENMPQTAYFTGQGVGNDATIERVDYATASVVAPTNGGEYALKLSHESNYWPAFRLNFGKELAAGTTITFQAYGKLTSGTSLYDQSIFEFSAGGEATEQFKHGAWTELTMTLPSTGTYVDLFWNYDRAGITSSTASGAVYIDNIVVVESFIFDITQGVDFENSAEVAYFTGQGASNDATIELVDYTTAGLTTPTNGGSYALKLSHESNYYPAFRINFGKELAAGTTISFMAYGTITSGTYNYNQSAFELSSNNSSSAVIGGDIDSYGQIAHDGWKNITITLSEAMTQLDMFWNIDRAGITSSTASGAVYIDNIVVVEPITAGVDFENPADVAYIIGQGASNDATIELVDYSTVGISAPTDGGNYALKLSHESDYYPAFRINFGKELAAGTTISFMAYGTITSGTYNYNQSAFELSSNNSSSAVIGGDIDSYGQIAHDGWKNITITLSEAMTQLDMFWNIDRAGITSSTASGAVYIDNIVVVEPTE